MKVSEGFFSFLMGFFIYSLLEIVSRGYTHWTMSVTGGVVLTILYALSSRGTLMKSCFLGAIIITLIELAVGIFDNLIMNWAVWDYSAMPLNFLGQICLPFSGLWFLLCIPAFYLCRGIRARLCIGRLARQD